MQLETRTIALGQKAPDFILSNESGDPWRLSEKQGQVRVLLFYPANETLVCTKQLCSVRDNWVKYVESRAEIVGVSTGSIEENRNFAAKYHLPLSILADDDLSVTRAYSKHWLYPLSLTRSIAVIDSTGIVRTHQILMRAFRPNDEDILTAIYAARSEAFEIKRQEIRTRIRQILIG